MKHWRGIGAWLVAVFTLIVALTCGVARGQSYEMVDDNGTRNITMLYWTSASETSTSESRATTELVTNPYTNPGTPQPGKETRAQQPFPASPASPASPFSASTPTPNTFTFRITGSRQPVEALRSYFAGRVPSGIALYSCEICGLRNGYDVVIHHGEISARLNAAGVGVIPLELAITTENMTRGKAISIIGNITPVIDGAGLAALVANGFGSIKLGPYGSLVASLAPVALKLIMAAGNQNSDAAYASRNILQLEKKLLQAKDSFVLRGDTGHCETFLVLTRFDPRRRKTAYTPETLNIPMDITR